MFMLQHIVTDFPYHRAKSVGISIHSLGLVGCNGHMSGTLARLSQLVLPSILRSGRLFHFRFSGVARKESAVPGRVVGLRREQGSNKVGPLGEPLVDTTVALSNWQLTGQA